MSAIAESLSRLLERLRKRKASYQLGKPVLLDLARFCRAHETCFHTDARAQALLEGRRQVWLRIEQHLNLSPEELAVIYRAAVLDPTGAHDG